MAAQNVSGNVTLNAAITQIMSTGVVTTQQIAAVGLIQQTLATGTGTAYDIDALYAKQLTLTAAATHINLFAFTDPFGNSVSFARVRLVFVQNLTLTAGYLTNLYTRTGTDPVTWLPVTTTGALWAPPGGSILLFDPASTSTYGFVVGSGAFDFTLDPGANTTVCNVIIAGNTAA